MDINTKDEALENMIDLLQGNDWLTEQGAKKAPLESYYSDQDGTCHITLAEDMVTDEFKELSMELFDSLKSTPSIEYIKTIYSEATEDIVYNNIDRYAKLQTIDISQMKQGDAILVYRKQCR